MPSNWAKTIFWIHSNYCVTYHLTESLIKMKRLQHFSGMAPNKGGFNREWVHQASSEGGTEVKMPTRLMLGQKLSIKTWMFQIWCSANLIPFPNQESNNLNLKLWMVWESLLAKLEKIQHKNLLTLLYLKMSIIQPKLIKKAIS